MLLGCFTGYFFLLTKIEYPKNTQLKHHILGYFWMFLKWCFLIQLDHRCPAAFGPGSRGHPRRHRPWMLEDKNWAIFWGGNMGTIWLFNR